jgi:ankyrin repeat protein
VKTLLDLGGSDVNVDYLGTSVSWAAIEGHTEVVQLLLDQDANMYAALQQGLTPLHCATKYHRDIIVKLLLDKDVCPDRKDINHRAPLQHAIINDNEYIVKLLRDKQADCESPDLEGSTPLYNAVSYTSVTIINVLLDHGADPNSPQLEVYRITPMHLSILRLKDDIVKLCIDRRVKLKVIDSYRLTALFHSMYSLVEKMVKLLTKLGANITVKGRSGTSITIIGSLLWHEGYNQAPPRGRS